jgi:hypothetical protein
MSATQSYPRTPEGKKRHIEQVRLSNRARYRAVKRLIEAHQEEFDRYYAEECEPIGVKPYGPRQQTVERKIAELQARLAELRE